MHVCDEVRVHVRARQGGEEHGGGQGRRMGQTRVAAEAGARLGHGEVADAPEHLLARHHRLRQGQARPQALLQGGALPPPQHRLVLMLLVTSGACRDAALEESGSAVYKPSKFAFVTSFR